MSEEVQTTAPSEAVQTPDNSPAQSSAVNEKQESSRFEKLRAFKKERGDADVKPEPESEPATEPDKTPESKTETAKEPDASQKPVEEPKKQSPREIREARIKQLKQELNLKKKIFNEQLNKAIKEKDEVAAKLNAFEMEKLARKEKEMSRDDFYAEAVEEYVPNEEYYKDLVEYYGPKFDTPVLDQALQEATNKHGIIYTLMQFADENPTFIDEWARMSPMQQKKTIREMDTQITRAKAETAARKQAEASKRIDYEGKTKPEPGKKPIPKSVVAETTTKDEGTEVDVTKLSPKQALAHFKKYGPTMK